MTNNFNTDSIKYKIGQRLKKCRLMRKYSLNDLASRIGVTHQLILQYEQGKRSISMERLYSIAEALSVDITALIPESTVPNEDSYFDEDRVKGMFNLIRKYKRIRGRELRKTIYSLTKSTQVGEERSRRIAKIEIARNLLAAGVSVDIISNTTDLSTDEYDNEEEKIRTSSIYNKIGQRIKEWRLIRTYTQEDLANKIGAACPKIHNYEQGHVAISIEKLFNIAKALSVNTEALLPESTEENCNEDGDTEAENELLSLMREYKKIKNQESRDKLYELVKSFSEGMQVCEEKVNKAERIKVAKNLIKAGISIDVIFQTTDLSADEIDL